MSNSDMLICYVFLPISFFLSFVSPFYFNTTLTTTITTHQCSILLLFKQNLSSFNFSTVQPSYNCPKGYNPIMMNWDTNSIMDCCYWDGVTCNHSTGDIIGLDLSCGMLQGTLHPNTSLFNLPHLQTLNLAFNHFTGQVPTEIGRLSNTLTHLNISKCEFSGQVPTNITLLHKLVSLDLSNNHDDLSLDPRSFINLLQNHTCLEELSLELVYLSLVFPTHLNISFSSLKLLNLHDTALYGRLPSYIFNLQSLKNLDLSHNFFTGQVPWEISFLHNMVSLDLSNNQVDLSLEPRVFINLLQNYTCLEELSFEFVNISSVLPTHLNISSSLKLLNLFNTGLHGKLPHYIFNLQSLEKLNLSLNNFTGLIPWEISLLPKLISLDLSRNDNLRIKPHIFKRLLQNSTLLGYLGLRDVNIGLVLPTYLNISSSMKSLDLRSCSFQGILPDNIFNLQNLEVLDLSGNTNLTVALPKVNDTTPLKKLILSSAKLLGELPDSFGHHFKSLTYLDLSSCSLTGLIPKSIGKLRYLTYLDLSSNKLNGTLPQFQWYGLKELYMQSNLIQGPFHPSICNMSNLMYLDLSNNRFDGVIPGCFGKFFSSLIMANLGKNYFEGTIPNVYNNCGRLEGLILKENQLEGELPSSLSECRFLKVLDMGNNHLNGTFPQWLESLPYLQVLVLKSNGFHGYIKPSSIVGLTFPSLQVIDLSHNRFKGQIPRKYFKNFNAMKNGVKRSTTPEYVSAGGELYSFIANVKGVKLEFTKLNVYYTIVSLSYNNFVGEIPDVIGNLNSLVAVDLSHNSLTGQIPHSLGKLSEIESLDLSCNQLTGRIPQSLGGLTSLEFLNLSQNHLVGLIPSGEQFNTFQENSFEGNPNLCGLPLPKKCKDNPQIEGSGDDNEEESGFTWKVVMLGYGCGTLFGLVIGYLMFSTGRPIWFNKIPNAMEQMILKRRNKRSYVYYEQKTRKVETSWVDSDI